MPPDHDSLPLLGAELSTVLHAGTGTVLKNGVCIVEAAIQSD